MRLRPFLLVGLVFAAAFFVRGLVALPNSQSLQSPALVAVATPAGGGGTTYTLVYDATDATNFTQAVGDTSSEYYWGFYNFNDSTSRTFTRIGWKLTKAAGTIVGKTFTCRIWTMSGSNLGTEIATSTGRTGDDAWNQTVVNFDFPSPATLSSGTNYTITIDMGGVDGSNYANILWNSTGSYVSAAPANRAWFTGAGTISGNNGGYSPQAKFYTSP